MSNSKKLSVQELAMQLTKENTVKSRSSKKSINSYLVDILGSDPKIKKTRTELTNEITLLRIQEEEEVTPKSFEDKDFIERFTKMNKTCKNGIDTAVANGKSASCFVSSEFASDYELIKNKDKSFSMKSLKQ